MINKLTISFPLYVFVSCLNYSLYSLASETRTKAGERASWLISPSVTNALPFPIECNYICAISGRSYREAWQSPISVLESWATMSKPKFLLKADTTNHSPFSHPRSGPGHVCKAILDVVVPTGVLHKADQTTPAWPPPMQHKREKTFNGAQTAQGVMRENIIIVLSH